MGTKFLTSRLRPVVLMGASPAPRPRLRCTFCLFLALTWPGMSPGPAPPMQGALEPLFNRCLEVAFISQIRKTILCRMVLPVLYTISKPAAERWVVAHPSRSLIKLCTQVGLWDTTAFGVYQMYLSACVSIVDKKKKNG